MLHHEQQHFCHGVLILRIYASVRVVFFRDACRAFFILGSFSERSLSFFKVVAGFTLSSMLVSILFLCRDIFCKAKLSKFMLLAGLQKLWEGAVLAAISISKSCNVSKLNTPISRAVIRPTISINKKYGTHQGDLIITLTFSKKETQFTNSCRIALVASTDTFLFYTCYSLKITFSLFIRICCPDKIEISRIYECTPSLGTAEISFLTPARLSYLSPGWMLCRN